MAEPNISDLNLRETIARFDQMIAATQRAQAQTERTRQEIFYAPPWQFVVSIVATIAAVAAGSGAIGALLVKAFGAA